MSQPARRQLFVTTALPYANGKFHIGHIMEYIQADIWVRFQRMQGHQVHFVCADDAHGAPIMIAAEKAGQTPQQFVAAIAAGRKPYLDGFHISFDNWHSTDGPENHALAQQIYLDLKQAGLIETRTIEQFFDPVKGMFLPDRYIKGECPKCGAKDQYGDSCEACGAVYAPTDLKEPFSALTGAKPVMKSRSASFEMPLPRVIKPTIGSGGAGLQQLAIWVSKPSVPSTSTPALPPCVTLDARLLRVTDASSISGAGARLGSSACNSCSTRRRLKRSLPTASSKSSSFSKPSLCARSSCSASTAASPCRSKAARA